ncbi:hypothetical protein [Hyphomonas atlantica corrig.]|nr:hypothetical protein [Hyphomonas atlantica]|tara:strand:+ start:306 stop:452 length:147 start_codon:yes stop_codon:yes gene_type:complete
MIRLIGSTIALVALIHVSACHTDPFGLEPEVDITLPDDTADNKEVHPK